VLDFPLPDSTRPVSSRSRPWSIAVLAASALLAIAGEASAGWFTGGNVVVLRVGDGTAPLNGNATAIFLDEYTPTGTFVQTLPLPTAPSGANRACTNAGSSTAEGFLNVSSNGQYFVCVGYDAAPGTTGIAGTMSAVVPRVIARIDGGGNIDTSTALSDGFSGGNIRSAISDDGTRFWAAGSVGGSRFAASLGATTSTQLNSTLPTNLRVINIFGGQLYVSSASGAFQGVSAIGTGLPTTSGQTVTLLPGFPTSSGPSAYDHFFASATTLYVADDRTGASGGGIQKWTLSAGTWTLAYTLLVTTPAAPTGVGCRGLTGIVVGGTTLLFATTTSGQLVRVVDTGAASAATILATAATNTAFRGTRMVPLTCAGPDCNANGIGDACDITLGFSTDLNDNHVPDDCEQNGGTAYCFGDTGCPCGNFSFPLSGQGCAYVPGFGAALSGTGATDVSADALVLSASNLPPPPGGTGFVLFFQGDAATSAPFNDGKRCAGGTMVRLATKSHTGTTAAYPGAGDPSVSVRGGVPAGGGAFYYQAWYRSFPGMCGTFSNLTNGVSVVWVP
jgi:hypothetical protein